MARGRQQGFTYFAILFAVAVVGLASATAATSWHLSSLREKERQLLATGAELRTAIERYVTSTPSGRRQYPRRLEDLVRDPRHPGIVRHLRRLRADPLTGGEEWGLVRAADGGIMGVYSLAPGRPLKTGHFGLRDARFAGAESYRDWVFIYRDRFAGSP
ncbi:MAG: type II secretion system protein [Betaproteobacteria bacterium]